MLLTTTLLAACSGSDLAGTWAELPLSDATDVRQLEQQIKANPSEWRAAAEFLTGNDLSSIGLGRHELTAAGTYANVQEYETKDSANYEAHREYIDIQVVVSGREQIIVSRLEDLSDCVQEYDPDADIEFFATSANPRSVPADSSHWVVLFPSDGHKPCITLDQPSAMRKIVVKIPFSPVSPSPNE